MIDDPPHVRQIAFVYVMRRADGVRKLGCTFDPDYRCRQLSNEMEIEYVIEKEWKMDNAIARAVERAAHKALKPYKYRLYEKIEYYKLPLRRIAAEVHQAHDAIVSPTRLRS